MSHGLSIHDGSGMIAKDPAAGILLAYGTTVPSDGAVGYSPGCKFMQTDGAGEATYWYVNVGTKASANFDAIDLNIAENAYLSGVTPGTGAASKALVLDSNSDIILPNAGTLTLGNLATAAESAEHGAGAIGTAATPTTYRWIESGVIITQIKIDLTGLASVATADDVIGLAAGGAAYIGRNVVATNGVIFKTSLSCIETPAGGDNDVNVVTSSSAVLAYDGAGGTSYISNSGDLLAGQTIDNLMPALTANDYYYLTAGTGDTAGTYTAGMYVLTLWGHALLA